ncbi:hypothetical protein AMECASPLE_017470 [Ameca splendens]|uniref:AXH domain-containing protein n=1 Tax=Ameca splendens TaxID=208324 RepID=A0ABV0XFL4_9TELE
MKSNQERSNECLPPKKRGTSSTLPPESRSPAIPAVSDRSENTACYVSAAGGNESNIGAHQSFNKTGPQYKSPSSLSDASSSSSSLRLVSSLPTVYTSPLSQSTIGGTVHYTQLPPNMQFITSSYNTPYTSYVSPQILPPPPPPPPLSSSSATQRPSYTETSPAPTLVPKHDQLRVSAGRTSMPPPSTDHLPHHIQMSTSPRTVSSPHHQGGTHLPSQSMHLHQSLGKYTDGYSRKEEGTRPRELHNGELERGRRFGPSAESGHSKSGGKSREDRSSLSSFEARHLVLPSDYSTHDHLGLRTSVMLMPNSHGDHQLVPPRASPEKLTASASAHLEKGSMGGSGSSYHTSLQQHLLIPGTQPVIIPVSGGGVPTLEPVTSSHITSSTQAAPFPATLPHTYIAATAPKGETLETQSSVFNVAAPGAVVQAQLHLPIVPVPPGLVAASTPPTHSSTVVPPSLPPYFIKGSIIQLADGELKRVEDLKTEDFIQSADISSELKIDSSTVERIEGSHTSPNFAVVQFSVGEHRTQVGRKK